MDSPDVVVIVFDDMRASDWEMLPRTQELVGGTWFPDFAITTPLCAPSRATLLTGRYARNHGVLANENGPHGGRHAFRTHEDRTLATALWESGYSTNLVGKYINGYGTKQPTPAGWRYFAAVEQPEYGAQARRLADHAAMVAGHEVFGPDPFLLWYAPKAPHGPIDGIKTSEVGPEDYERIDDGRRAKIAVQDAVVERIAAAMGPHWDSAVVVVVSDNGYLIGNPPGFVGKNKPLSGAVNVPALVRCPGLAPGTDLRLAATIDVCPTILRAAGVEAWWPMDGLPLQDAWDRESVTVEGWDKQGHPLYSVDWHAG